MFVEATSDKSCRPGAYLILETMRDNITHYSHHGVLDAVVSAMAVIVLELSCSTHSFITLQLSTMTLFTKCLIIQA